jgi:hypothetical protein
MSEIMLIEFFVLVQGQIYWLENDLELGYSKILKAGFYRIEEDLGFKYLGNNIGRGFSMKKIECGCGWKGFQKDANNTFEKERKGDGEAISLCPECKKEVKLL